MHQCMLQALREVVDDDMKLLVEDGFGVWALVVAAAARGAGCSAVPLVAARGCKDGSW